MHSLIVEFMLFNGGVRFGIYDKNQKLLSVTEDIGENHGRQQPEERKNENKKLKMESNLVASHHICRQIYSDKHKNVLFKN